MVKPAEAEAERVRILAKADAERTRIQAEAAASNNRVALDQLLINQLPLIVKEAAAGLAGANVSVLNGADGLGEIAAGLVSQGLTILDSVRKGMPDQPQGTGDNGVSSARSAAWAVRRIRAAPTVPSHAASRKSLASGPREIWRFADVVRSPDPDAGTSAFRLTA